MSEYNQSDDLHGTSLEKEYDEVFSGEEKVMDLMKITNDKFTTSIETIKVNQIGLSEPTKLGRQKTITGLTQSIKELGVLTPIHVLAVSDEVSDDDYKYALLDGLRRYFGAVKNNIGEIQAVVWRFHDVDMGRELALSLGLILNKSQKRSWSETWDLYRILEMRGALTPGTLEYLLQMNSGDAMKLKDVMLCDYSEVKEALLSDEKDLEGCYKMLQKLRKEEDALAKEDATGFSDTVEGAEEITTDNTNGEGQLSDQDVMELLEMADSLDDLDVSEEDFSDLNQSAMSDEKQKVGERHPVDPAIRQGTFQRDRYMCRCCGTGGVAFLATLVYHHAIPVHCGGADSIENGLTLCDSCHLTLHSAEKIGGKIPMTEEQFKEYPESEQNRIKLILKYSKIAVEASKRKGISKEKIKEEANRSARHRMPGEGLKENQIGYATKSYGSDSDSNE